MRVRAGGRTGIGAHRLRRVLLALGAGTVLTAVAVAAWVAWPLPAAVTDAATASGFSLEDRYGLLLREVRAVDGSRQGWIPLAAFDADVIAAFVSVEDRRFYRHHGVDLRAVARAVRDNFRNRRVVSGASTISMQLARLLYGNDRDWLGKMAQALEAIRLEAHLSKQQILELYLNRVPLGQGTVGVPAAARLYFGASAREMSLGQASLLAGIARYPSTSNPLVSPSRAAARRAAALTAMRDQGYATASEAALASREPVRGRGAARRSSRRTSPVRSSPGRIPPDRRRAASGGRRSTWTCSRRSKPKYGTRWTSCDPQGAARPRRSCSIIAAAKCSPGSGPRISGPIPRARWTWSSLPGNRVRL